MDGEESYPCDCEEDTIELTKAEACSIVQELRASFISRDNPLLPEVLTKLSNFVDDK